MTAIHKERQTSRQTGQKPRGEPASSQAQPLALVVFLENVGYISGLTLPRWAMRIIDFVTEEYAKILLRLYGAHRLYERVVILEDEQATGEQLQRTLLDMSATHGIDLLLLVHGHAGCLVGRRGEEYVGDETFAPLLAAYREDETRLNLRMVYGVNCYGASLAPVWLGLGATVSNGSVGVNWMPEPSLSIFLRNWLRGQPYSVAVQRSNRLARRVWSRLLWFQRHDDEPPAVASSRQIIFGHHDVTIHS